MRHHAMSKKDLKDLSRASKEEFGCTLDEPSEGLVAYIENARVYIADKTPIAIELDSGDRIPAIHLLNKGMCTTPHVTVDQGAVPRILNGADVMAPGIIELSEFAQGSIVGVREPQRRAFIAVGRALMSSQEIMAVKRGRAIKNLHHAGDRIWQALIEIMIRIG